MPRGRKPANRSSRELLEEKETLILGLKDQLAQAKLRKKELEEKVQQEDQLLLYQAVQQSGLPMEEALQLLQGQPQAGQGAENGFGE